MPNHIDLKAFSDNRLMGQVVPIELELLLAHAEVVQRLIGIEFGDNSKWTPWLDVSYLSEAQLNEPDIKANVDAIAVVCKYVLFVAATENSEYIGYWRGPQMRPLSQSSIICLDNEGQFTVLPGRNIIEALLADIYNSNTFTDFKRLFESVGLALPYASHTDIPYVDESADDGYLSPAELHKKLYHEFRNKLAKMVD